jgi:hypothetical protein
MAEDFMRGSCLLFRLFLILALSFSLISLSAGNMSGTGWISRSNPEASPQKTVSEVDFKFASAYKNFPAATSKELGLQVIERKAALVYYNEEKKQLAGQLADVLDRMHVLAGKIVGVPIVRLHGLILAGSEFPKEKLPKSNWINIAGVPCLLRSQKENTLPLETALSNHMVFPLLIHESIDIGIKEEVFSGLYMKDFSWRWYLEGIADYCAIQASAKFQKGAFEFMKKEYLDGLNKLTVPRLDLTDKKTWWPEGSGGNPKDVTYAYAAADYMIMTLAKQYGEEWIGKTLAMIKSEGKGGSDDFCRVFKSYTGADISNLIKNVEVNEVKKFVESL